MDFIHIGYHDQVPWAAHACKILFGSVPNLSNYGHEMNRLLVFIIGTVSSYHVVPTHVKYHLALCQI